MPERLPDSPSHRLGFWLMVLGVSSLAAQPILVTNHAAMAGQATYNFGGVVTISAFNGEAAPTPNALINSGNLTYIGVDSNPGDINANAINDRDTTAGGADQERLRLEIAPGHYLSDLTWQWSRADGPLATDGVTISGFNSDPGALFSGGIVTSPAPTYSNGKLNFQITGFNSTTWAVTFANLAATTNATLEIVVSDSTQAGAQFAIRNFTVTPVDLAGPPDDNFNRLAPPQLIGTGTVTLSFLGVPGYKYALERVTNLNAPVNWMPVVTNTAGTNGSLTFTNTSSEPENYFRARYVPNPGVETRINGDFWFDLNGNKVDATEMSITKVGSYYYAFGNKRLLPSAYYDETFKEFRCYRSTNLRVWEFCGTSLTAANIGLGTTYSARCKVIYNDSTAKYVMWFKLKDNSNDRGMGVAVSSSIEGPYTFLGKKYATSGQTGDMSLFQEGTNAYAVSSDVATRDIVIDKLTSDYLDIASHVHTIPAYLEAPQLFKVGTRYYCIGSGVTGWNSNQSKYSSSTSLSGGWSSWANFGNNTTYDSQGSDVFVINGSEATTAIFCADRWEPSYLGYSTYVWLPIVFSGSTASIAYRDSFTIDTSTGLWGPGSVKYYKIINKYSGKALTVLDADAAGNPLNPANNGADIVQWTYNGNEDWFQWRVEGTTDGYKKIINKYSGRAMEVFAARQDGFTPYSASDNSADICQFDYYDNNDTFKWKAQELGYGYRSVINKFSGKAAVVFAADAGGNPLSIANDGADVAQFTYNASQAWHQWLFLLAP